MGFMSMKCATDSDTAADLLWSVGDGIEAKLRAELLEKHSDWNTPPEVNVALAFEEVILPAGGVLLVHDGLKKLAVTIKRKIKARMNKAIKRKRKEFVPDYRRMLKALSDYQKQGRV